MIEPTPDDIGRSVKYTGLGGEVEYGVITSYNDSYVFVRYEDDQFTKATKRDDLHWTQEEP